MTLLNHDDLILMPETTVREKASGRIAAFRVLSPIGRFAGVGRLRVLRARPLDSADGRLELICGYEAYEPLESRGR